MRSLRTRKNDELAPGSWRVMGATIFRRMPRLAALNSPGPTALLMTSTWPEPRAGRTSFAANSDKATSNPCSTKYPRSAATYMPTPARVRALLPTRTVAGGALGAAISLTGGTAVEVRAATLARASCRQAPDNEGTAAITALCSSQRKADRRDTPTEWTWLADDDKLRLFRAISDTSALAAD